MILIYGKGKVGNALAEFCTFNKLAFEIKDDKDGILNFDKYDKIVPSPGIPPNHPIYKTNKIVGELDFIYDKVPSGFEIISITGTDGKSTTTWILYNLLVREFGEEKVFLAGNFDEPFSSVVTRIQKLSLKKGYIVNEISSFMAYNVKNFKSDYSIFTNFDIDHLNWHPNMDCYLNSKLNIIKNTKFVSVINIQILEQIKKFGIESDLSEESNLKNIRLFGISEDKNLKDRVELPDIIISGRKKYMIDETNFSGGFNALNILSATIITNEMGICSKRTREYLKDIKGLSHRIELYKEISGIRFIDDSKSTSCQSLMAALSSFENNVILIAGGIDKGDTFEGLSESIRGKVKFASLIGQTKEIIAQSFKKENINFVLANSMDDAVKAAIDSSKKGNTIILSPGCASLDMFKSYEDRANKFKDAVDKYMLL